MPIGLLLVGGLVGLTVPPVLSMLTAPLLLDVLFLDVLLLLAELLLLDAATFAIR